MQCVILAAGRGTRMRELTEHVPKPMLSILGKPILEWKLELLPEGIDEVIFVVGYLGEQIEDYFGREWKGRALKYVRQETLDGSGGAILLVRDMLSGPVLVTMGDDFYHRDDLADLMREQVAVLGLEIAAAQPFGLLATNTEGNLESITERPHGFTKGIVNTGAYLLPEEYFGYPSVKISETEYGLPQTLALLGKNMPVKVLRARAWQPIGCPEDLVLGEAFLRRYASV